MKKLVVLIIAAVLTGCGKVVEPIQTIAPVQTTVESTTAAPKVTKESTTLINKNSDDKTKKIMQYLTDNYGTSTISGQYVSSVENSEMNLIYSITGKYPAMLLADLNNYSLNGGTQSGLVDSAEKWGENDGLVSLMWHWNAPINEPHFYTNETTFDLSKAVTDIDISMMSAEEIQKLCDEGKISRETVAIVADIDNISLQLKRLEDAGVTVLWRPLHEACGGWFWWGSKGVEAYKWLWKLMVERQTNFQKLNNLIWVWNGQASDWYVGDDYCDIISSDIYTENQDYSSQSNEFNRLNSISNGKKILAISECGTIPDVDLMHRDNSVWSFYGLWYGEYIMDELGAFSNKFTSSEKLKKIYNDEATITLDELPDFDAEEKSE